LSKAKTPRKTVAKDAELLPPSRGKLILREGALIGWLVVCVYLIIALVSHSPDDPGWSHTGTVDQVSNAAGALGAWLSDVFYSLLGYISFLFPVLLALRAWNVFRAHRDQGIKFDGLVFALRILGLILVMVSATSLASLHYGHIESLHTPNYGVGGILGLSISEAAATAFNHVGSTLILLAVFLFGLTVFTDLSWLALIEGAGITTIKFIEYIQHKLAARKARKDEERQAEEA